MRKTSKLVTIILIIMIILVVGIVSYYGFNYFKNKNIDKKALEEVEEFDRQFPTITLAEYEDLVNKGIVDEKEDNGSSSSNSRGNYSYGNSSSDNLFVTRIIGTIRIPKTGIKYPIYTPPGEKALEEGIGMLVTTNGLNKVGNTTLQGHNWLNWMFFSRNNLLKNGDSVFIKDSRGVEIEYIIYKKMTLKPSDSKYITRDTKGKIEISLTTCTNAAKDRLVILAREKK